MIWFILLHYCGLALYFSILWADLTFYSTLERFVTCWLLKIVWVISCILSIYTSIIWLHIFFHECGLLFFFTFYNCILVWADLTLLFHNAGWVGWGSNILLFYASVSWFIHFMLVWAGIINFIILYLCVLSLYILLIYTTVDWLYTIYHFALLWAGFIYFVILHYCRLALYIITFYISVGWFYTFYYFILVWAGFILLFLCTSLDWLYKFYLYTLMWAGFIQVIFSL